MAITPKHNWTLEKLQEKSRSDIEDLRARAVRHGADDLVSMCDEALQTRPAAKKLTRTTSTAKTSEAEVVVEYHFVCSRGRGVTEAGDGRFWSGSWVVAQQNATESLKYNALLALHESKAQPSYRQGRIVEFRRSARDMISKENEGIEFLVEETNEPLAWVGSGAGEKGYRWRKAAGGPE
jgi:hypothetical protein